MEKLPKDVLSFLALDMDIEYVIRLCQTSSAFNEKICKNSYFWLNKLQKDYNITTDINEAKNEYLTIKHLLKTDPNVVLESGINSENLKLVQGAVEAGADLNRKIRLYYPITLSIVFDKDDIFVYLMRKMDLNNIKDILQNIFMYNNNITLNKNRQCRLVLKLYEILLPYAVDYFPNPRWKNLWITVLAKIEQLHVEHKDCITDEFYNNWIDFYRKQAE